MRFLLIIMVFGMMGATLRANEVKTPDPDRFKEADAAFKNRADEPSARKALTIYRAVYKKDPKDTESAWRLAMACYFVGIRFTKDSEAREKLYEEGRDAGLAAIELNKKCAGCYFWTAINSALYGEIKGPFKMYFSLGDIKEYLSKSIAIDPGYAYAGAYRLLGQIDEGLPGILGGNAQRAEKYYRDAIAAAPDEPLNYLFLTKLLYDDLKDTKTAIEMAKKALALPKPASDRVESNEALEEIRQLLPLMERGVPEVPKTGNGPK